MYRNCYVEFEEEKIFKTILLLYIKNEKSLTFNTIPYLYFLLCARIYAFATWVFAAAKCINDTELSLFAFAAFVYYPTESTLNIIQEKLEIWIL